MPILALYKDKVKQRINKFRIILIEFNNYGIMGTVQNLEKLGRTIMEKLKLSLIEKWDMSGEYTFVHSCGILSDGRALVLTS